MSLSGQQFKKLQEALIDAFPMKSSLEQMLLFELNKKLETISGEGNLETVIFTLIKVADSQGWVEALVEAAHKSNSGNLFLKSIARELLTPDTVLAQSASSPDFLTKLPFHKKIFNLGVKHRIITGIAVFLFGFSGYNLFFNFSYIRQTISCYKKDNNTSAYDCFVLGFKSYENKDYNRAIYYYNLALKINDEYASVYNNRGIAYGKLKKYNRAIEDANKAIQLNPKDTDFYNNRGYSYQLKGNYEMAIADYTKALELDPNNAHAKRNLSKVKKER